MLLKNRTILIMGIRNKWSIAYGIAKSAYENGAKLLFTYMGEENKNKIEELISEFSGSKAYVLNGASEDEKVKEFVGSYKPEHYLLNKKEPMAIGPLDLQAYLFEHKVQQAEAMKNAKEVILEVAKDFEKMTGRKYGLFEEYKLDDAEIAIVCMNSTAGTTKFVVDNLRKNGIKAGLLKIRVFRPFPAEEIAKALANVKAVAVLDKADSLNGAGGALFTDVASAMYVNKKQVPAVSYIYGIGGRDTTETEIASVYTDLQEIVKSGKVENPYRYLGLKEEK